VSTGQHYADIFLVSWFLVDEYLKHSFNGAMAKLRTKSQKMPRALLASVVAFLFILQILSIVITQNGRVAFAKGGIADASINVAGEICGAKPDDGGRSPVDPRHPDHCHHCILCSSGAQDSTLSAWALLATVFLLFAPRPEDAPAWRPNEQPVLWPSGLAGSWRARAPPIS
jgi:hypothetical protein